MNVREKERWFFAVMAILFSFFISIDVYTKEISREKLIADVRQLADMVILSQDLFSIDPEEISTTEVFCTFLGRKIVYEKR